MTGPKLIVLCASTGLGLALLLACGSPDPQAPADPAPTETPAARTAPPPPARLKKDLPATCALLPPDEVQALIGLPAKRWKKNRLETESPLLSSCAWRLQGTRPVILSLVVRTNPNPKKRKDWSRKVLQPLIAQGRTDKKGRHYAYRELSGLGSQAAFSSADGQLRWSEGHHLLFTLHTQKADLLTREQFLTLARAVSAKVQR